MARTSIIRTGANVSALSDLELKVWTQVAVAAATGGAIGDIAKYQRVGTRAAEIADKVVLELRHRHEHGVSAK